MYYRIQIKGIVQGVGFRPFIFRVANQIKAQGFVRNNSFGVEIISNKKEFVDYFKKAPVLSKIEKYLVDELAEDKIKKYSESGEYISGRFRIISSDFNKKQNNIKQKNNISSLNNSLTNIPADISICKNCILELFDKDNRRFNHYYISCTDCGPRFSIAKSSVFDRDLTSMDKFEMCNECKKEYEDPLNRRFHAQTIACNKCGPRLRFFYKENYKDIDQEKKINQNKICSNNKKIDWQIENNDIKCIEQAIQSLKKDKIIAIKGVGGFHLCCNIKKKNVNGLKDKLKRHDKPLALMFKDIEMLEKYCSLNEYTIKELESSKRPIVLVKKKKIKEEQTFNFQINEVNEVNEVNEANVTNEAIETNATNEKNVTNEANVTNEKNQSVDLFLEHISELDTIGAILPYTALHYLLFSKLDEPIVFTSANVSGIPTIIDEEKNASNLFKLCDCILSHDREIVNRCDDSIVKNIKKDKTLVIRRSRGMIPKLFRFGDSNKKIDFVDTIAFGADKNNTIAIAKADRIIVSQHIGNLGSMENEEFLMNTLSKMLKNYNLKPQIVVCDLHPMYESSRIAKDFAKLHNIELIQIQHHEAHGAGTGFIYGLKDYTSIVADGLGYGKDNTLWGGEVFEFTDSKNILHVGGLKQFKIFGGDSATKEPKKILFSILREFLSLEKIKDLSYIFEYDEIRTYESILNSGFGIIKSSSIGRILDSAAILLGLFKKNTYDARGAMLLESFAGLAEKNKYASFQVEPKIIWKNKIYELDYVCLFEFLYKMQKSNNKNLTNIQKANLAMCVFDYIAKGLYLIAKKSSKKQVVFTGGVSYNRFISSTLLKKGVLINKDLPSGDGGISIGQCYLANLIYNKKKSN